MDSGQFYIEVRRDLCQKGKGLFATKDFPNGDIIFIERPLVSSQFLWNATCKYKACDHCVGSLETAEQMCKRLSGNASVELPHSECCTVRPDDHVNCQHCSTSYCSESCRQEAWKQYHQSLCLGAVAADDFVHPLCRLLEAWKSMHYPPETCSIMLIVRMIATIKQSNDKASLLATYGRFCRATVNEEQSIAHKLLGEQFQGQLELLRGLLIEMFSDVGEVQQWLTPDGFRSLFALIGTNGQGIGTSSFSTWVKNCEALNLPTDERLEMDSLIEKLYSDMDEVSGQFLDCEGSGLYSLQSSCNHSCCPNAEVTFPNNNFELVLKAVSDIKMGDEIFISYLTECDIDRSRHSRQKILRENYLFNCQCDKCISQASDPDMTSEEEDDDEEMDS